MDNRHQVLTALLESCWDHFYPYLLNEDIGKIDSALAEKSLRELYFKQVSKFYLKNSIRMAAELAWIMKRDVDLAICRLDFDHNPSATHQGITHLLTNLPNTAFNSLFINIVGYLYTDIFSNIFIRYTSLSEIRAPSVYNLGRLSIPPISEQIYPNLQVIDFTSGTLTGEEVLKLCQRCPNLQSLSLGLARLSFTNKSVQSLVKYCPNLHNLVLIGGFLSALTLTYLTQLIHLTTLDLSTYNMFTTIEIQTFIKGHIGTNLEVLKIGITDTNYSTVLQSISTYCPIIRELSCRKDEYNVELVVYTPDEAVLSFIRSCPCLEVLDIADYSPTDAVLCTIAECCPLFKYTVLNGSNKTYSNLGLIALSRGCPQVTQLLINNNTITDAAIVSFAEHCHELEFIQIINNDIISSHSLCDLLSVNPGLTRIRLGDCDGLNDSVMYTISQYCPKLTDLILHDCTHYSEDTLITLVTHCHMLKELYLDNSTVSSMFINILTQHCKYLRTIRLKNCIHFNIQCVILLLKYSKHLIYIEATECGVLTEAVYDQLTGVRRSDYSRVVVQSDTGVGDKIF